MRKLALGMLSVVILASAAIAVPNQLTYSGRLLQNGALVNSSLQMDFRIYSDPTAGNLLWQELGRNVEVNQGIYSVELGSVNTISPSLFVSNNAYLQVTVGTEDLMPRTKINSVGYALQAGGLSKPDGGSAIFVSANGYVGIGTTNPVSRFDTGFIQLGEATPTPTAGMGYGLFQYSGVGLGVYSTAYGTNQGMGFWTASGLPPNTVATESVRFANTGRVGVGIKIPTAKLHIVNSASNALLIETKQAEGTTLVPALCVSANGNVGVGTNTPNAKLQLNDGLVTNGTNTSLAIYGAQNGFSNTEYANIFFGQRTDSGSVGAKIGAIKRGDGGNYSAALGFFTSNLGSGSPLERMSISDDGNVGIGSTGSAAKLHINVNNSSTGEASQTAIYISHSNVTTNLALNTFNDGSWQIYDKYNNSWHNGLSQRNGYVGVGTTSPTEKLEVKGNLKLSNSAIKSGNIPALTTTWQDLSLMDAQVGGLYMCSWWDTTSGAQGVALVMARAGWCNVVSSSDASGDGVVFQTNGYRIQAKTTNGTVNFNWTLIN
ncbi:MAG: hypothetical protein WC838_00800 [Candidatus Margulisiibacteriota bacterium]